mgnify:CR=1 FL=1
MAEIDLEIIRFKREEAFRESEEIRAQIQSLQERLIEKQARIGVYDELLGGTAHSSSVRSLPSRPKTPSSLRPVKRERGPRTTKAEMVHRKQVVAGVFAEHGDLQPKHLLPLVQDALGHPLEAHHLRAVLRRYSEVFQQRAEHGLWGLVRDPEAAYPSGRDAS